MSLEHVNTVLLAACCLHNLLRDDTCHWTKNNLIISISVMNGLQNDQKIGGNFSISAVQIRDLFKSYFNSAHCLLVKNGKQFF